VVKNPARFEVVILVLALALALHRVVLHRESLEEQASGLEDVLGEAG
jgi:hypothetical protein